MDWKNDLPEDIRNSPAIKDVKDVPSLAKQFVDLQAYQGQSIRIPSENAGEEDRKAFYDKLVAKVPGLIPTPNPEDKEAIDALWKKLGRPAQKEEYKIPEGVDPNEVQDILDLAHKSGLTVSQAEALLKEAHERVQAKKTESEKTRTEAMQTIKKEWGLTFEDRISKIEGILKATGAPKDLADGVASGVVGPETVKWLHTIASQMKLDEPNNHDRNRDSKLTPVEAKNRISEIMSNRDHPYWKASDPGHADAIKYVVELHRMSAGG